MDSKPLDFKGDMMNKKRKIYAPLLSDKITMNRNIHETPDQRTSRIFKTCDIVRSILEEIREKAEKVNLSERELLGKMINQMEQEEHKEGYYCWKCCAFFEARYCPSCGNRLF